MEAILNWLLTNLGIWSVIWFILAFIAIKNIKIYQYLYSKFVVLFKVKRGYLPSYMLKYKLIYWTDFKIDSIKLADPGREKIFKDMLKIKFKIFNDNIFNINQGNMEKIDSMELLDRVFECFSRMRRLFITTCETNNIPDIVIRKFLEWNKPTTEFVMLNVESICKSPIYTGNNERLEAIYSLYTVMLETTIVEAERSLNALNGELSGIEYKGIVCA